MSHSKSGIASINLLLWSILIGLILTAGCKTQQVETRWSAEPVKVDGEMTDWPSGSTVYFEDPGVQLGLRNDGQNLYVLVRFDNQAWARAIRMGGLTVWLDNSGKKKKDFGIRYFGGPWAFEMQGPGDSQGGGFREALSPEQQQRLEEMEKDRADQILVIDEKVHTQTSLPADGSEGPAASSASSQGAYTYELSLPLQKGEASGFGIGTRPGKTISLGFEWGGVSREERQKMTESMGGGPPGGMGEGRHPGMGGRGGPRGGGFHRQSTEKQDLWVKTKLASPVGQ